MIADIIKFNYVHLDDQETDFEVFLSKLPAKDRNKLLEVIKKTQEHGLVVAQKMKWVKKLTKNLYELRSKVSTNIQRAIYFHIFDNNYVITHGFTKKTQKTPRKEIERGERIRKQYLSDLKKEKNHGN